VFCFVIHACAYCSVNEKFSTLHEAKLSAALNTARSEAECSTESFEFTVQ